MKAVVLVTLVLVLIGVAGARKWSDFKIKSVLGDSDNSIVFLAKDPGLKKDVVIKMVRIRDLAFFPGCNDPNVIGSPTQRALCVRAVYGLSQGDYPNKENEQQPWEYYVAKQLEAAKVPAAKALYFFWDTYVQDTTGAKSKIVADYKYQDAGQEFPFIVLEKLDGDLWDLREKFEALKSSSKRLAGYNKIIRKATAALAAMHKAGYFHFDVKPDNFYFKKGFNGNFQLKIADFGTALKPSVFKWYRHPAGGTGVCSDESGAKALSNKFSFSWTAQATAPYAQPEACPGKSVPLGTSYDAYAMGMTALAISQGKNSFNANIAQNADPKAAALAAVSNMQAHYKPDIVTMAKKTLKYKKGMVDRASFWETTYVKKNMGGKNPVDAPNNNNGNDNTDSGTSSSSFLFF